MAKKKKNETTEIIKENIINTEYTDEMKQSFLDYSMSVIVARAIPDILDGLKPVHRRILFTMNENGLNSNKPYKKCADTVGSVLGKYHPHGDTALYDALVVMGQDWKKNKTLIDGHGNFGSIEGDGAAHYRYTESRLTEFSEDIFFRDLNKNTTTFIPNYDNSKEEPTILPARVPIALINGTEGIAVGMTTSTPPHSFKEIMLGYEEFIKNPKLSLSDALKIIPGPDFPTGGIIVNKENLEEIYKTGKGKIKIRGKVEFEKAESKRDRDKLVITEIPYTMIGSGINAFLNDVMELVKSKKLPEIVDIINQSSREGIRLVLELKPDSDIERIKNILYKKTRLEDTFGVNMLYIYNGRPTTMPLLDIFDAFYKFQTTVQKNKYDALYKKEKDRLEILNGLIEAIDLIDLIIEILRGSKNYKIAKNCLMGKDVDLVEFKHKASKAAAKKLSFTELQAQAILDMKLSRLIGLELSALLDDKKKTESLMNKYKKIISSKTELKKLILSETDELIKKYSTPRKTEITNAEPITIDIDFVPSQDCWFVVDKYGYSKLYDVATFERNKPAIEETNKYIIQCKNNDTICVFANTGVVHQIKLDKIPFFKFKDKGVLIDTLSNFNSENEQVVNMLNMQNLNGLKCLFITKFGMSKYVMMDEFVVSKRTIASTKLRDGDEILRIFDKPLTALSAKTNKGQSPKFKLAKIPLMKKTSVGVKGVKLKPNDYIVDFEAIME